MSDTLSFIEMALRGDAMPDEIEDFIEFWHRSDSTAELHDFLGLTWDEYSLWVSDPEYVNLIIGARRNRRSLVEAVNDNLRHEERLAARADRASKLVTLQRWIAAQTDR